MKLDCEGHELGALAGAAELLAHAAVDEIQFQFGGCNLDSRTFFRVLYTLLSPRYQLFRVLRHGLARIPDYSERLEVFGTTNFLVFLPSHPLADR